MQRACNPCVSVTANVTEMSNDLAEFGARLHSMCGVTLDVSNKFQGLEDAMEFCKSALGPLQDLLADERGKRRTAETTVVGLEATM